METLINICNAYLFEGKLDLAARYCEDGLTMSMKIIELLDIRLISYQLSEEDKGASLQHLHHILRLYLQSLKIKGHILELNR